MYNETQTEYLPDLLRRLTNALTLSCHDLSYKEIIHCLDLCFKVLTKVQPSMTMVDQSGQKTADAAKATSAVTSSSDDTDVIDDVIAGVTPSSPSRGEERPAARLERVKSESSVDDNSEYSENYISAESDQEKSPAKVLKTESASTTLIQACVQAFQNFYYVFLCRRIFPSEFPMRAAMDHLMMKTDGLVTDSSSTDVSDDSAFSVGQDTGEFGDVVR